MAIQISGCTVIDNGRNIVNVAGVGNTSTTVYYGDGSNLSNIGVGTDVNINTSGIVTASAIYAEQFVGTGDQLIFSPVVSSLTPAIGQTSFATDSNIVVTYDQLPIYKNSGNIEIRSGSPTGTLYETIDVTSGNVTLNNSSITINPTNNLPTEKTVYVVLNRGIVKNSIEGKTDDFNWSFETEVLTRDSISPANNASNVNKDTNITLTFNNNVARGTGTITLRRDSTTGTILESYDAASSNRITITNNQFVLDPSSSLPFEKNIYLVIPNGAIVDDIGGEPYAGMNVTGGDSHVFNTNIPLGCFFEGGYPVYKSGGTAYLVSCQCTENWPNKCCTNGCSPCCVRLNTNPASCDNFIGCSAKTGILRACQDTGYTDWFIPTCSQWNTLIRCGITYFPDCSTICGGICYNAGGNIDCKYWWTSTVCTSACPAQPWPSCVTYGLYAWRNRYCPTTCTNHVQLQCITGAGSCCTNAIARAVRTISY